jgi:hypothetical protein
MPGDELLEKTCPDDEKKIFQKIKRRESVGATEDV